MKKANKKPTRAEREAKGAVPVMPRCSCGFIAASRYAMKEHKEVCNGMAN